MPTHNEPKSRLRQVRAGAPRLSDISTAFSYRNVEPREKAVLVAIACAPNSNLEHLAEMTGMDIPAVRESLQSLSHDDLVWITITGGYLTANAVAAIA